MICNNCNKKFNRYTSDYTLRNTNKNFLRFGKAFCCEECEERYFLKMGALAVVLFLMFILPLILFFLIW